MIVWFKADQNKGPNFGDQIRGDSMISAFRMGPVASGRGLYDVVRVLFEATKSCVRKLGSECKDFPIFGHVI